MRPILFSFGNLHVLAAPVFAGFAAIAAALYIRRNRAYAELDGERYWDLMLPLAVGTIGGGVLLYFFFYGGGAAKNWANFLRTHRVGGGAFYGDIIGALTTAWVVWKVKGLSFRKTADLIGAAAPLGLAVMRLGCLQHGCCYGKRTDLPWGIVFSDERSAVWRRYLNTPLHPTQVYEFLVACAIFAAAHFLVLPRVKDGRLPRGSVLVFFLVSYGVLRFMLEFLRGSDPGLYRPYGLTTAQALAVASATGASVLWAYWKKTDALKA
ncbi:MAG: prolipoprotein diacylglyceryl transferase [Elusimicrobia bacterium]|nr:prolipoprotein diacylglyceryl transferase [Elusimicrobiota bacterium]